MLSVFKISGLRYQTLKAAFTRTAERSGADRRRCERRHRFRRVRFVPAECCGRAPIHANGPLHVASAIWHLTLLQPLTPKSATRNLYGDSQWRIQREFVVGASRGFVGFGRIPLKPPSVMLSLQNILLLSFRVRHCSTINGRSSASGGGNKIPLTSFWGFVRGPHLRDFGPQTLWRTPSFQILDPSLTLLLLFVDVVGGVVPPTSTDH